MAVVAELRRLRATLAFAESCTGGQLSAAVTEQAGISDIFMGSVVSYSNAAKVQILGISQETLRSHGAVAESTAREMARGARTILSATWSVAVTGIAGPTGGTALKPVGMVCFAVSGPRFEESRTEHFTGQRGEVQKKSVHYALSFLLETLKKCD